MPNDETAVRARGLFSKRSASLWIASAGLLLLVSGCVKKEAVNPPPPKAAESQVHAAATANAVLVDTPAAEFAIAPNGYVAASLLTEGRKLSLDDAGADSGVQVTAAGKDLPPAVFDVAHPQVSEPHGPLGTKGKRIEVTGDNAEAGLRNRWLWKSTMSFRELRWCP